MMTTSIRAAAVLILAVSILPASAVAASALAARPKAFAVATPAKDCTRFNGRFGYYGNPWCSPAEQDRWDRWEAARARRK